MRHAEEALKRILDEHLKSTLVPFMARFGFNTEDDHHFTKGDTYVHVTPSAYQPLEFPWILSAVIGKKSENDNWEKPVLSKNKEPYYTRTVEETAATVKRLVNDLEEQHLDLLEEK